MVTKITAQTGVFEIQDKIEKDGGKLIDMKSRQTERVSEGLLIWRNHTKFTKRQL